MQGWRILSLLKKIVFALALIILPFIAPELMLFIDVGGIEMALSFLLLYYKPVVVWFQKQVGFINDFLSSCKYVVVNSSILNTKVFISQSVAATLTMIFTGSLFFSLSPFVPALFISGIGI